MTRACADDEILQERLYAAPRDRVFAAWTDPKELDAWWGPDGFVTETSRWDFRPGGAWVFTLRHPEYGTFANRVRWLEIDAPRRLLYDHDSGEDHDPRAFRVEVTFDDHGGRTQVRMRSRFTSAEAVARVRSFGAVELGKQTLAHLAPRVEPLPVGLEMHLDPVEPRVTLRRFFRAPVARVWAACTDPAEIPKWWGPEALPLVVCEHDLRVGGRWRHVSRDADGREFAFHGVYREVVPECRTVTSWRFEGVDAESTETVLFEARDGGTLLTNFVVHTSMANRDGHVGSGMERGARESMDRLARLVDAL